MERIIINTANAEDWENIEDQLDANGIDDISAAHS